MTRKFEQWLVEKEEAQTLFEQVLKLPPRQAAIIVLRFGLDGEETYTLRKCAQIFKTSTERIRQLQDRALDQLKTALGDGDDSIEEMRQAIEKAHPLARRGN